MEECEALCTRIGIMVAGKFECLGSPQHLKGKYGSGYEVCITVVSIEHVQRAIRKIQEAFKRVAVKEVHQRLIQMQLLDESVPWSRIFSTIERLKKPLHIVDYSVSQTTLEQIFLEFSTGRQIRTDSKARTTRL